MADKDKRDEREDDSEDEKKKPTSGGSKLKSILLLAVGAVLLVAVSIETTLLMVGKASSGDNEVGADASQDSGDAATPDDKKGMKGKKGKKGKSKEKEATGATNYLPLDPPFVVNFAGNQEARFLQVSIEVMARDPASLEDVKKHMPAIRNSLVLLLSSQDYKTLSTLDGKEKVRAAALTVIQQILQENTGKPGVDAVYFTGFVMQ